MKSKIRKKTIVFLFNVWKYAPYALLFISAMFYKEDFGFLVFAISFFWVAKRAIRGALDIIFREKDDENSP